MLNVLPSLSLSTVVILIVKYKMQTSHGSAYGWLLGIGHVDYDCLAFLIVVDSFVEAIRYLKFTFINVCVCVFLFAHEHTHAHHHMPLEVIG